MSCLQSRQRMQRVGAVFQQPILDKSDEALVPREASQAQGSMVIDLITDDEQDQDEEEQDAQEEVAQAHIDQGNRRVRRVLRNRPLDATHLSERAFEVNGTQYSVGQFVELIEPESDYGIQFVEIKSVNVHKETADAVIRGLPYARTRNLLGRLPRKQNEVCLILEIDDDDERPEEDQALITIAAGHIKRTRTLINTNKPFPACRFDEVAYSTTTAREEEAPVTCRWKMRVDYRDHYHRTAGRWNGGAVLHMTEHDHGIKRRNLGLDKERSRAWRGEASPRIPISNSPGAVEADGQDLFDAQPDHTYTFADFLCGSGGISRGAEMAGLKVVAAVDPWSVTCDTYAANFPYTRLYEMDITEFVEEIDHAHVDILHISPSLQLREKDDEANAAAVTAFSKVLGKLRPRVLTVDQNPVLGSDGNTALFGSLIKVCTSHGYSVRWKIIPLVEYGLPQLARKRLFIIGAAPGEELPPWPRATHSFEPEGDQKPYVIVREAICNIDSELHSLHNPAGVRKLNRGSRLEEFGEPLNGTIPISGTPFIHPSGSRDFTMRELASLHGFPVEHHFEGAYIKKQIGNAFPPSVARVIFQQLQQWLKRLDGAELRSCDALRTASQSEDASQRVEENQAQKDSTGSQDRDETRHSSHDTETIRHGSSEQSASPQPSSAASTPIISSSQNAPMRHTSSPEPEPPETPSSSSRSELDIDNLVPDISPSIASSTGPDTSGFASSPRAASTHKRRQRASREPLHEDDADEPSPEILETPSKRPRYSSPRLGCHQ